jgi:hypothetical protein
MATTYPSTKLYIRALCTMLYELCIIRNDDDDEVRHMLMGGCTMSTVAFLSFTSVFIVFLTWRIAKTSITGLTSEKIHPPQVNQPFIALCCMRPQLQHEVSGNSREGFLIRTKEPSK